MYFGTAVILSVTKHFILPHPTGREWSVQQTVSLQSKDLSAPILQEETFQGHVARISLVIWGLSVIRICFKN